MSNIQSNINQALHIGAYLYTQRKSGNTDNNSDKKKSINDMIKETNKAMKKKKKENKAYYNMVGKLSERIYALEKSRPEEMTMRKDILLANKSEYNNSGSGYINNVFNPIINETNGKEVK